VTSGVDEGGRRVVPEKALSSGDIHVWVLDVTAPWYDALADSGLASDSERRRALGMTNAEMARALLARRAALRQVMCRYLELAPDDVDVVTAPGGKPVLLPTKEAPALSFSIGHSGDRFGVAVGAAPTVGFDIERFRPVPRADAIAERWFASAEARSLDGLEGAELERAFMRVWTAKEALAKRHGAGLRLMMRGDVEELDTSSEEEAGRLKWVTPGDDYLAAIASSHEIEAVTIVVPEDGAWLE